MGRLFGPRHCFAVLGHFASSISRGKESGDREVGMNPSLSLQHPHPRHPSYPLGLPSALLLKLGAWHLRSGPCLCPPGS